MGKISGKSYQKDREQGQHLTGRAIKPSVRTRERKNQTLVRSQRPNRRHGRSITVQRLKRIVLPGNVEFGPGDKLQAAY